MSSRKKLYSNESYYLLKYSVWALVVCPQFLLTLLNAHLKLTSVYFELYILNYVAGVSLSWPPYCLQTCSPTSVHKLKNIGSCLLNYLKNMVLIITFHCSMIINSSLNIVNLWSDYLKKTWLHYHILLNANETTIYMVVLVKFILPTDKEAIQIECSWPLNLFIV